MIRLIQALSATPLASRPVQRSRPYSKSLLHQMEPPSTLPLPSTTCRLSCSSSWLNSAIAEWPSSCSQLTIDSPTLPSQLVWSQTSLPRSAPPDSITIWQSTTLRMISPRLSWIQTSSTLCTKSLQTGTCGLQTMELETKPLPSLNTFSSWLPIKLLMSTYCLT